MGTTMSGPATAGSMGSRYTRKPASGDHRRPPSGHVVARAAHAGSPRFGVAIPPLGGIVGRGRRGLQRRDRRWMYSGLPSGASAVTRPLLRRRLDRESVTETAMKSRMAPRPSTAISDLSLLDDESVALIGLTR